MFVRKDITEKIRKMSRTMSVFFIRIQKRVLTRRHAFPNVDDKV